MRGNYKEINKIFWERKLCLSH